jgi:catechol 2,3-dioxygenase-like lactoylglutathione lyase family enzyme
MPVIGFNHFNLRAPQPLVDRLRDFYVEVVGLHVGWRPPFDFGGYWLYLGEQAVLHLVEAPAHGDGGTYDHIAFTASDAPGMEARLREQGVPFRSSNVPATGRTQIFVKDPAGNGVEFNFPEG